jgi:hypothetical protein
MELATINHFELTEQEKKIIHYQDKARESVRKSGYEKIMSVRPKGEDNQY